MVPPQYIYIVLFGFPWIWTILFFLNIVKKNPIPSSVAGLIFTTWALLLSPWHEKFSLFFCIPILLFEFFIVYKTLNQINNPINGFFFNFYTNIAIFSFYLSYLFIIKKTFFDMYFQE